MIFPSKDLVAVIEKAWVVRWRDVYRLQMANEICLSAEVVKAQTAFPLALENPRHWWNTGCTVNEGP
jgi:hypothetical protein